MWCVILLICGWIIVVDRLFRCMLYSGNWFCYLVKVECSMGCFFQLCLQVLDMMIVWVMILVLLVIMMLFLLEFSSLQDWNEKQLILLMVLMFLLCYLVLRLCVVFLIIGMFVCLYSVIMVFILLVCLCIWLMMMVLMVGSLVLKLLILI